MPLSLSDIQNINKISDCLYSFLPGTPHPYGDSSNSFPGVAKKLGLYSYWTGGSKKPAIIKLLQSTLQYQHDKFCELILEIVRTGMVYRESRREPITREEITRLNQLLGYVNFKIPELWNLEFINCLPSSQNRIKQEKIIINQEVIANLKNELIKLTDLKPQERGFAFEKLLNDLFDAYNLDPRKSFRIIGEQIDGSFQIGTDVYLVEAKWQDKQIDQSDLLIFNGKVEGKSSWSRGLFVSYSGFTPDGLTAFSKGRSTKIVGMDSQDIFHILNGEMSLVEGIIKKARRAAETGDFFVSIYTLSKGG